MVDWKQIPKIDAHIHLMPNDVIEANKGYDDPFVDYGDVNDYLKVMDTYNIESAFIMPFNDPYMLSMEYKVENVHANLKSMVYGISRLYCFADVDIKKDITETIKELDRVFKQKEFIGIKLHPTNTGYPIDGNYYEQIIQYASDNSILVEVHSYPREHLSDDVCSPRRIKNVLSKYPDLKLSIAHLGGFQYQELVGVDAYINISAILPDLVNRMGIEKANEVLRMIGVDKLVFASDYPDSRCLKPSDIYDTYLDILSKMDFTQQEAEDICKHNALSMIYGVKNKI